MTHDDFYINGNWVLNPLVESKEKFGILTQGPLDNTSEDFWEVVLNFNI